MKGPPPKAPSGSQSSQVKSFDLLISQKMVDLDRPVIVTLNGKRKEFKVSINRDFAQKQFARFPDPESAWCDKIKIEVADF